MEKGEALFANVIAVNGDVVLPLWFCRTDMVVSAAVTFIVLYDR